MSGLPLGLKAILVVAFSCLIGNVVCVALEPGTVTIFALIVSVFFVAIILVNADSVRRFG